MFKLEQFEGPLALLVKLIDKAELDITQVSLATVADQYIAHLRTLVNIDPEEMADFLVIASRLLLVKAKALLPYLLPEEEEAIEDLEQQLRMYKDLDATKKIEAMVAGKKFMFAREFNRKAIAATIGIFAPPAKLTTGEMAEIFRGILEGLVPIEKPLPEKTMMASISIEDKIELIKQTIKKLVTTRFSQILTLANSKVEIVVSFLAMLELMKQRTITADQGALFEEIEISNFVISKE